MRESADVVIVGGGVVGASIAYHLTRLGVRDVVVLERGGVGSGSTGRAMGGVRAQFADPLHIRMSLFSMEMFERLGEITGFDPGYLPHGYLLLATTDEHVERLEEVSALQRAAGLDDVQMLNADEVGQRLPFLETRDVRGAAFRQRDGFIDPLALLRGFRAAAERAGCRVEEGAPVTAIVTERGRVVGVQTASRSIATRVLVNAAGAWSASVAALVGSELPVTPLRRQIVRTGPVTSLSGEIPMVIDLTDGFHFRPDPRESGPPGIRIAGPDARERRAFDEAFDPDFVGPAVGWACRRAPRLGGIRAEPDRCSAGLYAMTPDHHAILGEDPRVQGFFQANGFSGHGVMHSPATGRILAELITDGRSSTFPDAERLGPGRFAAGALLHEPAVF